MLTDGKKPAMHSIILLLISLLAVAIAVEFNWMVPVSARVMFWNEKDPQGGAIGVGGLWRISVEQFTGGLTVHVVVEDNALSWLQVSEISSPTQAVIFPLIWDGQDVRKFEAKVPSLSNRPKLVDYYNIIWTLVASYAPFTWYNL